jgi:imidazolonepropionase-like amidohydrolase
MKVQAVLALVLAGAVLCGCATAEVQDKDKPDPKNPFPSTYQALPGGPTAIVGATILTGTGDKIAGGTVLVKDGKVEAVGANLSPPPGYAVVNARGKWVTPGIIDVHSHLGVYPSPGVDSLSDGNEATDPNTAEVWAEHCQAPRTFSAAAR